jgi:hypothetical protein
MKFTAADKRKCAEREVAMRRRVYPRHVANRTMLQVAADREIALMQEIADDYRKLEEPGLVLPLFPDSK